MRRVLIFFLLIAALAAGGFYTPALLKDQVAATIRARLAHLGYPDTSFNISKIDWSGLRLETISLDKEGINTIRTVDVTYTPFSLIAGRIKTATLDTPEIFFDSENQPNILGIATFALSRIPADSISVNDLQLGYAGEENNLTLRGSAAFSTEPDGTRKFLFSLKGNQQEISLILNGVMAETTTGSRILKLEMPQARLETSFARLSRATSHMTFTQSAPGAPFGIEGELIAGALKIGPLMMDGLSIAAKGQKPTLVVIGSAGVTGLPQTTFNLRMVETEKGASFDLRLAGDTPSGIVDHIFEGNPPVSLSRRQNYVLSYKLDAPSVLGILDPSAIGTLSLALDAPDVVLTASVNCQGRLDTCAFTLPETKISTGVLNRILSPELLKKTIELNEGAITAEGRIGPPQDTKGQATDGYRLNLSTTDLAFSWHGLPFRNAKTILKISDSKGIAFDDFTADVLGGTLESRNLSITNVGNGTLDYIDFSNLDLSDFLNLFPIEGLKADALLAGHMPLSLQKGNLIIDQDKATLSLSGGYFRYTPRKYPEFLEGQSPQMEILRQTMGDFRFDEIKLGFGGPLLGEMTGILSGTGKNPALFGESPVGLDIRMSGKIPASLRKLIP